MRPLIPGVYVPLPCFFDDNEELDLQSYAKHVLYTARAGVYPVLSGSMGEAVHLTHQERKDLIRTARAALDQEGYRNVPIIAGAGGSSTRETIQFAIEAAEAGADQVIVISPGYFAGSLSQDSFAAVKQFYVDVAEASPLPVLMYNFPSVTGGIDMDSDLILSIAKDAPNVCGIKLTCGAVGKLTRVAAITNSASFIRDYPRKDANAPFLVLGGFVDILLPSIYGGAGGVITGIANFAPHACRRLWELSQLTQRGEQLAEAQHLQGLISAVDWELAKGNIPGMKYFLSTLFGYNPRPRRPLLPYPKNKGEEIVGSPNVLALLELEKSLAKKKLGMPNGH